MIVDFLFGGKIGIDVWFFASVFVSVCLGIVNLILTLKKESFDHKKRSLFSLISMVSTFFLYSFYFNLEFSTGVLIFSLMLDVLLNLPVFFVVKEKVAMEESKEFIKYIDGEIEKQDNFNIEKLKTEEETEKPKENKLDFSVIKTAIDRLKKEPILNSEKKVISEVSDLILNVETDGNLESVKEKLNDRLDKLITIMSKYSA